MQKNEIVTAIRKQELGLLGPTAFTAQSVNKNYILNLNDPREKLMQQRFFSD
jgi:hypothetical protein